MSTTSTRWTLSPSIHGQGLQVSDRAILSSSAPISEGWCPLNGRNYSKAHALKMEQQATPPCLAHLIIDMSQDIGSPAIELPSLYHLHESKCLHWQYIESMPRE
uniref:Uncharacterized protein n=1 Tax=Picea glauca TaxID=3330 RepID=A0A101LZD1_PICGL|nr:hypothetical protein ABT39_MTgene5128 [Picea glauca]QHR86419.1 hypothetical protein Q903MT_gene418 [Picea sitchensis]